MVNPNDITDFNRSHEELEEFLLFSISVANKRADVQAEKLDKFLMGGLESPFYFIRKLVRRGCLEERLRRFKLGKYSTLVPSFSEIAKNDPNLFEISRSELEEFYGIGPKTSRFFLLHSREGCEIASLDTHILKWLDDNTGGDWDIPDETPEGEEYAKLQKLFLEKCGEYDLPVSEIDLRVWNYYSGNEDELVLES